MTKKHKIFLFIGLGVGITVLWVGMWILMCLGGPIYKSSPVKVADINYYKYRWYEDYDGYYYQLTRNTFNTIKPVGVDNYLNNFYIFYDYTEKSKDTGVSVILDLKFNDINDYNNLVSVETNKYNFYEELKFSKNNYVIKLINDDAITRFRSTKTVPYSYGAICLNEKDLIIRYVSFADYKTVDDFSNLFECSLCKW
ncbi:MAG: hypothetical protein IJU60_02285 [Acholeplasmatales bacterium]|nr:hypothetical protein [Acholeplasmatales bacterium]